MELTLANIISVLPLLFYGSELVVIVNKLIKNMDPTINIKYFYGLVFSTYLAQAFKYLIPYPKWSYKYVMRPDGAKDCDYLSCGGVVKPNTPGMPSGHMTTTSFVIINNILKHNYSPKIIISNIILLCVMGWARITKKCHTLIQVIAGTLLGCLMGSLYFFKA